MATEDPEDLPPSEREATDQEDNVKEVVGRKRKRGRKKAGKESVTPERRSKRRKEQVTPEGRPSRERKTVERYSFSSPRRESTPRAVVVKQGRGTKLRDIPNVFFKLSKWKADDSLHYLHKLLFGKTAKANYVKRNIFQFSGFVWADGEEKGKLKLREKLGKCVKGRLLEFCDVLDIPVARATTKKENLLALLLDFLQSPHVTRDVILEENEQSGNKRKRRASLSSEKTSIKKRRRGYKDSVKTEEEENQNEEKEDGNDADDNVPEKREDEQDDKESEQEEVQKSSSKKTTRKSSRSIANKGKGSEKEKYESKECSKKNRQGSAASTVGKSVRTRRGYSEKRSGAASRPKSESDVSVSRAGSKRKSESSKKNQAAPIKEKKVTKKHEREVKSQAESSRKKKGKGKASEETVVSPTQGEIQSVVGDILKEVDFYTTTSADILRQLEKHFGVNLTNRSDEVKTIIEQVITEMSDDESASKEEDGAFEEDARET